MSFLRAVQRKLFEAPYPLLPLAVWLFFAVCFTLHPDSPLRTHALFDTDDYMRLNEVINWLQSAHPFGDGWYDLSHPRLSPGENPIVHWDRMVDLPLALFAYPLIPSLGLRDAMMISGFIVPPLLFAVLLLTVTAAARPLIGRERANLAAVMILFAPADLLNFMPGRVDHHGYQIIIAACGLFALSRAVLCPRGWKAAIFAAVAFACGLWIGTEALPWATIFIGTLGLLASWRGGFAMRNAAVFGLAFPLAVACIMPLALRPQDYASLALSWFSGADLVFAGAAGAALLLGWAIGRNFADYRLRILSMGSCGMAAAAVFVALVPDTRVSVFADYDAFHTGVLLNNIGEARPLINALIPQKYIAMSYAKSAALAMQAVLLPLIAITVVIRNFLRGPRRMLWFMHGAFLIPAFLLTIFWQSRVSTFAQLFTIIPITWLLWHWWDRIAVRRTGKRRYISEIFAFLAVSPSVWPATIIVPGYTLLVLLVPVVALRSTEHGFYLLPLLLVCLALLMPSLARPLLGRKRCWVAALLLFAPAVLFNFSPGNKDFHAYQIILAAFSLNCLIAIILCRGGWVAAIAGAIACATAIGIGSEAHMWVMTFLAALVAFAGFRGGYTLRNGVVFAIAYPMALYAALTATWHFQISHPALAPDYLKAHLLYGSLLGCVFAAGWLCERIKANVTMRLLIMALTAFVAIGAFTFLTPDSFSHPVYAPFDTARIGVPHSLIDEFSSPKENAAFFLGLRMLFLPLLAAFIVAFNLWKAPSHAQRVWLLHALFLYPNLFLAITTNASLIWFAQIFSLVPIAWFLQRTGKEIDRQYAGRTRLGLRMVVVIVILIIPSILHPAIAANGSSAYLSSILFAAQRVPQTCPMQRASAYINAHYGDRPHLILSGTNEGPELLFRTNALVLAAPYNVDGNADAFDVLNSRDDGKALDIVNKRKVDLILVCRNISPFYADLGTYKDRIDAHFTIDAENRLRMKSSTDHPALIEKLINLETPKWLRQVPIPDDPNYLLFEVKAN